MSFFDKIKGGIGLEEEKEKEKPKKSKPKKKTEAEPRPEKSGREESPVKGETRSEERQTEEPQAEGELAIDVYETADDIIIQSTIGGIKPEDLDISIENDMVTIRGSREHLVEKEGKNYIYQECYWGSFARKVILPEEVNEAGVKATMKNGVLTLTMPKLHRLKKRKIAVKPEPEE